MKFLLSALISCITLKMQAQTHPATHVVIISLDGLRPEMYQDSTWPSPNLQALMKLGTYAKHMKSVFPAYTYPSHTAMMTGALPARSGIYHNQPRGSKGEWFWFTSDIKVPTLWQALKAKGMTTGAVEWPLSVSKDITYDIPEIWDPAHPGDRITAARKYADPNLIREIEQYATGQLDSISMDEESFIFDENAARAAAYIFTKYKPSLLALHLAGVDGTEHEYGRDHDSVGLTLANVDRGVGIVREAIKRSGLEDSTTIIIVGDHGFVTFNTVFRPNILIKDLPVRFNPSGGSAFLYSTANKPLSEKEKLRLVKLVEQRLDSLPAEQRNRFHYLDRHALDKLGADSAAIMALSAEPGLIFSGAIAPAAAVNHGPGTLIQQNAQLGLFAKVFGGHHGYDPNIPQMYTGFIAAGAGINRKNVIDELCVTDIAPLIAKLLGIDFKTPDGKLVPGIVKE